MAIAMSNTTPITTLTTRCGCKKTVATLCKRLTLAVRRWSCFNLHILRLKAAESHRFALCSTGFILVFCAAAGNAFIFTRLILKFALGA